MKLRANIRSRSSKCALTKASRAAGVRKIINTQEKLLERLPRLLKRSAKAGGYGYVPFDFEMVAEPIVESDAESEARLERLFEKYDDDVPVCGWTHEYMTIEMWLELYFGRAEELVPAYQLLSQMCETGEIDALDFEWKDGGLWVTGNPYFEELCGVTINVKLRPFTHGRMSLVGQEGVG